MPIFITGRFRSGSTLLWNIFRHLDGITSYYEPLNERRWFDPAVRGERVDTTHRQVTDYWRDYDGLAELGQFYQEDWIRRHLYMDAEFWEPALKRYIEVMVAKASGRAALQFNRVDFRLPWLRRNFPEARLIHIYRHPRDQWCSSLMDIHCFPKDGRMADFAGHDKFYLRTWAEDLKYHFPFLDELTVRHPYQLFYFIWRLSYLFGRQYAHCSVGFEDLITNPRPKLTELLEAAQVANYDLDKLCALVEKPGTGKWREYASNDWFRQHESECESALADFFGQPRCLLTH